MTVPNWANVLNEIEENKRRAQEGINEPFVDNVRRKYLLQLHNHTNRNIIAYYLGWLQKTSTTPNYISDFDKNGLMNAVHELDKNLGLDLLLHTPGGSFAATVSLVDYLHKMFGTNIRCFIPQIAMSGGTMIACACKEIIMGKQSNIGPIDPQINGFPAYGIIDEFNHVVESVKKDPGSILVWRTILEKYEPALVGECSKAIKLARETVEKWLINGMFADNENREDAIKQAKNIVNKLNNHADTKNHAYHIHAEEALSFGLKISMLEDDNDLQDLVLTVHHAYMHSFSGTAAVKIIENHLGRAIVLSSNG